MKQINRSGFNIATFLGVVFLIVMEFDYVSQIRKTSISLPKCILACIAMMLLFFTLFIVTRILIESIQIELMETQTRGNKKINRCHFISFVIIEIVIILTMYLLVKHIDNSDIFLYIIIIWGVGVGIFCLLKALQNYFER